MVNFAERVFWMIVWVLLILVLAGFLLHLMNVYGILPQVGTWIGRQTNLQAQAGG